MAKTAMFSMPTGAEAKERLGTTARRAAGFAGGVVLGRVINKIADKALSTSTFKGKQYVGPVLNVIAGAGLAVASENDIVQSVGAGHVAIGALDGVKQAFGKDLLALNGLGNNTVDEEAVVIEAEELQPYLPELNGSEIEQWANDMKVQDPSVQLIYGPEEVEFSEIA